ncbi:MAG TPA: c-type cytochrome [Caldimonas sp.]|nr:c-type cytochrome [Caldimonas sp.]
MSRPALVAFAACAAFGAAVARTPVDATSPPADADAPRIVQAVCSACHGVDGNGVAPRYPALAGQGAAYLFDQLQQFAAQGRRPDGGVMAAFAVNLDRPQMQALADYYARQPRRPRRDNGGTTNVEGERIFMDGVADAHVPACASCHGARGDGLPPRFPRLAGQHAGYLAQQLRLYRSGTRISDRDGLMRAVASRLNDHDIDAVASYAAALH